MTEKEFEKLDYEFSLISAFLKRSKFRAQDNIISGLGIRDSFERATEEELLSIKPKPLRKKRKCKTKIMMENPTELIPSLLPLDLSQEELELLLTLE